MKLPEIWYSQEELEGEKQELIGKFLDDWDYMMERIEFHTGNPDSELMDEVREKYEKWEGKL
jgi:hypothetical protein